MTFLLTVQCFFRGRVVMNDVLPDDSWSYNGTVTHITNDDDVDRCMELDGSNSAYFNTSSAHYGSPEGYWGANVKTSSATQQAILSWTRTTTQISELTLGINAGSVYARCRINNVDIWELNTDSAAFADGNWHRVAISGGTSGPQIWVDGMLQAATFSIGTTANTEWTADLIDSGNTYLPNRISIGTSRTGGVNLYPFIGRLTNITMVDDNVTPATLLGDSLYWAQPYDVFVLAGQSNMVGRDTPIDPLIDSTDVRIRQMWRDAPYPYGIRLAEDPLQNVGYTPDSVGPGMSMAREWLRTRLQTGRRILLVPVAQGNTGFRTDEWNVGTFNRYTGMVDRALRAMSTCSRSKIVATCWQLGEKDSTGDATERSAYTFEFREMVQEYRRRLSQYDFPQVIGTMPQVWVDEAATRGEVQSQILEMQESVPDAIVIDARDLPSRVPSGGGTETIHYSVSSAREIGRRYAVELARYWTDPSSYVTRASSLSVDTAEILTTFKADPQLGTTDGGLVANVAASKAKTDLIGTGTVQLSAPVSGDGELLELILDTDYLAANSRALEWTFDQITGITTAATGKFGLKNSENDTEIYVNSSGAVTDLGDGTFKVSFDIPNTALSGLSPEEYDWSVEVLEGSYKITIARNRQRKTRVNIVEKQT